MSSILQMKDTIIVVALKRKIGTIGENQFGVPAILIVLIHFKNLSSVQYLHDLRKDGVQEPIAEDNGFPAAAEFDVFAEEAETNGKFKIDTIVVDPPGKVFLQRFGHWLTS